MSDPGIFETINPATGEKIASYRYANQENLETHLQKAADAQKKWQCTKVIHRAEVVRSVGKVLRSKANTLAQLITAEMGKPITAARLEIEKCAMVCDYYAEHGPDLLQDKSISNQRMQGRIVYQPLGTILAIMPWNFPFWQVFRFAAPNLLAGNTGLLKHSHNVAACAAAITEVFTEAGAPENVFSHVYMQTKDVEKVLGDDRIAGVTLTGSTRAGKSVGEIAGRHMKKGVYELGGSDPYIVLKDADIETAASICAQARLINSGQSCIAGKRFLVVPEVYASFTEAFAKALRSYPSGDPLDEKTKIGPIARQDLRDELADQVKRSVAAGAKIEFGGEVPADSAGYFYPVTLMTGVKPGIPAFDEEMFGPVAAVTACSSEEEAFAYAAQSIYGLGAAIFTADIERGIERATNELPAGCCAINTLVASDPDFPFGGIKQSGYGRELGEPALREFVNIKSILIGS